MRLTQWLKALGSCALGVSLIFMGLSLSHAGDLLSSLDLAWSQDATLQSAVQAHRISQTRVPQARAALLPAVNVTTQTTPATAATALLAQTPPIARFAATRKPCKLRKHCTDRSSARHWFKPNGKWFKRWHSCTRPSRT